MVRPAEMNKLDEALARLEQAVSRLEAASGVSKRSAPDDVRLNAIADLIAARVDGALGRIGRVLGTAG